jgi:hypothetical protein
MKRATLLFACLLAPAALSAQLQAQQAPPAQSGEAVQVAFQPPLAHGGRSGRDGIRGGRAAARDQSTAGYSTGGFAGGFLLPVLGSVVAYMVVAGSTPDLPAGQQPALLEHSAEYRDAFTRTYVRELHARRKRAALAGSLAGSVSMLALLAVATAGALGRRGG